jgi:hypothetical protein
MLHVSKDNLDRASRRLLDMVQVDAASDAVGKYVSCFHVNIAGNYWWS